MGSVLLIALVSGVTLNATILLVIVTQGLVYVIQLIRLRPVFHYMTFNLKSIWKENSSYGFHVYVGSVGTVAAAHLFGLLVGYLVNLEALGYFSLALTISMPLSFIGSALGTTYFKKFAHLKKIPREVFAATLALGLISLLGFMLIIRPVVLFLYSEEYRAVIQLAHILAVGSMLHGFGDFFNRFLGAHGRGIELRNGAFVVVGTTLGLGVILVSQLGAKGAALTRSLASLTYFFMMAYFYLRPKISANGTEQKEQLNG